MSSPWKACFSWGLLRSTQTASPSLPFFYSLRMAPECQCPHVSEALLLLLSVHCVGGVPGLKMKWWHAHKGRPWQLKVNLGLGSLYCYHLPKLWMESEIRPRWCNWTTITVGLINQLFNKSFYAIKFRHINVIFRMYFHPFFNKNYLDNISCLQTFCKSGILHDHNKILTDCEKNKVEDLSHSLQIKKKKKTFQTLAEAWIANFRSSIL